MVAARPGVFTGHVSSETICSCSGWTPAATSALPHLPGQSSPTLSPATAVTVSQCPRLCSGMSFPGRSPSPPNLPAQGAREKLQSSIFERVNACNALLYEVRRRGRTQDELQQRLQQLLDVKIDDKLLQEQVQVRATPSPSRTPRAWHAAPPRVLPRR